MFTTVRSLPVLPALVIGLFILTTQTFASVLQEWGDTKDLSLPHSSIDEYINSLKPPKRSDVIKPVINDVYDQVTVPCQTIINIINCTSQSINIENEHKIPSMVLQTFIADVGSGNVIAGYNLNIGNNLLVSLVSLGFTGFSNFKSIAANKNYATTYIFFEPNEEVSQKIKNAHLNKFGELLNKNSSKFNQKTILMLEERVAGFRSYVKNPENYKKCINKNPVVLCYSRVERGA